MRWFQATARSSARGLDTRTMQPESRVGLTLFGPHTAVAEPAPPHRQRVSVGLLPFRAPCIALDYPVFPRTVPPAREPHSSPSCRGREGQGVMASAAAPCRKAAGKGTIRDNSQARRHGIRSSYSYARFVVILRGRPGSEEAAPPNGRNGWACVCPRKKGRAHCAHDPISGAKTDPGSFARYGVHTLCLLGRTTTMYITRSVSPLRGFRWTRTAQARAKPNITSVVMHHPGGLGPTRKPILKGLSLPDWVDASAMRRLR